MNITARAQNFTQENLVELIRKLVDIDRDWIPTEPGTSLYIRRACTG